MKALRMVIRREWHRMTSRRLYLGVCVVLPLLCLFFMATIFGNGQMENIPVGIVDLDNTATSRNISRRISAAPTFRVTEHFTDEADARRALQQKDIYGYLVIPPRFEQKAVTGTGATLTYYYHYALLSVGSELMAAFENTLAPVALSPIVMQAEALGVSGEQIQTFLLPVEASTHPLYNPDMDYSIYLSQPFFFVLFQILILLTTVYSIGGELKFGVWWIDCNKFTIDSITVYTDAYNGSGQITTTVSTTKATTNKTTASTTTTTKKTTTATNGPKPSVKASLYGDVNLDGRVDITDAVLLNKKVAGVVILNDQQYANADCCTDDGVGQADSTVLLQFLVSIVRTLPAEG